VAEALKNQEESRIILPNASWGTYERLLEKREERRYPRFFYDRGVLEILSPPTEHDGVKKPAKPSSRPSASYNYVAGRLEATNRQPCKPGSTRRCEIVCPKTFQPGLIRESMSRSIQLNG
jgi:hypothetical protein